MNRNKCGKKKVQFIYIYKDQLQKEKNIHMIKLHNEKKNIQIIFAQTKKKTDKASLKFTKQMLHANYPVCV